MEVLEFTKDEFRTMFETNPALSANLVDWYSMYVNRLLYETAHQGYNHSFLKLCNLLYLLLGSQNSIRKHVIDITQDDIADLLGISRVNLTRGLSELRSQNIIRTHRKQIEVIDLPGFAQYCSLETLSPLCFV